jgi:hypothetical protein
VLAFDEGAAAQYADVVCERERAGRPIGVADAQIAAICRALDAALATRNTGDFLGTGIKLVNPSPNSRSGPATAPRLSSSH